MNVSGFGLLFSIASVLSVARGRAGLARDEVEPLAVGGEVAVVARPAAAPRAGASRSRRDRRRRRGAGLTPCAAARRRWRRGRLVGRLVARLLARLLRRLLVAGRRRRQLVVRLERRALARLHRDVEDLRLLVEERLRLARAPRAADHRDEVAVRQEVEPLAVRAERRASSCRSDRSSPAVDRRAVDAVEIEARHLVGVGRRCRRATCRRATSARRRSPLRPTSRPASVSSTPTS